ncbi:xylulokinase [Marivita sp. S6314]|uniref:xylulokinase n=1 Tax=Marivita sp. S6314 TaxID=2926406 RepID=UPI001FF28E94|nr:xylulokinase [Marivita sp. S6314]MCK0150770.1 xylulokinase [Marivita sp. S6314]
MFIGLDLGTSGLKAVLVSEDGAVVASASATYPNAHPRPGWSEQDPADWITACRSVMHDLGSRYPDAMRSVRAIGLSGQMHGAVLLDARDQVLRPAMLWNDTRAHAEAARLDADPMMRRVTGNIVFPGFTAPKLVWVKSQDPEVFQAVRSVLLPKDHLRFWLTGDKATDASDASGTAWFDVARRDWSADALDASHMRLDQMPQVFEGSQVTGQLREALLSEWGLSGPVDVVGGGGDNAVAACAAGCLSDGQGFVSLGTSGVLLAAKDCYAPDPDTAVHTFCHALPDRWYQMGVILAATDSLNWLARTLGTEAVALVSALPDRIGGPSDLIFLPYLSGDRTPHNDAKVRGGFIGLDISHTAQDMTQAVLEGVAYALTDCHAALEGTGTNLTSLVALGGGAQSTFWCETLATLLGVPLQRPSGADHGAALGAARLAMIPSGKAPVEEIMAAPGPFDTIAPRDDVRDHYLMQWNRYRRLYDAVAG